MTAATRQVLDVVELSWPELRNAAHVGIDRFVRALSQARTPRYGVARDDWQAHVVGAWGECAVAKMLGCYWTGDLGRPDQGAPDVGPYHVRSTTRGDGCLILHDRDPDDGVFVLAVGSPPTFRIPGWCYGSEGKRAEFWQTFTGRPCFMVPQSDLHPMSELP